MDLALSGRTEGIVALEGINISSRREDVNPLNLVAAVPRALIRSQRFRALSGLRH